MFRHARSAITKDAPVRLAPGTEVRTPSSKGPPCRKRHRLRLDTDADEVAPMRELGVHQRGLNLAGPEGHLERDVRATKHLLR